MNRSALSLLVAATLAVAAPAMAAAPAPPSAQAARLGVPSQLVLANSQRVLDTLEKRRPEFTRNRTALRNFVNGEFNPNTAPAYARWDAMVAYEEKNWALRLNVKNVFDKLYYDAIYDNGAFTVPGTRRAAILTGELKY